MQKASKILLWISLGIGLLHVIATVAGAIIGDIANPVGESDSTIYMITILYHIARTTLPLAGKLMIVIIILFTFKSKSENIVTEIIAIILYADNGVLLFSVISYSMSYIIGSMSNAGTMASYSYMNMGANWFGFLQSISTTLFIVGVSFAIAHKKVELADIRRMLEEEDV